MNLPHNQFVKRKEDASRPRPPTPGSAQHAAAEILVTPHPYRTSLQLVLNHLGFSIETSLEHVSSTYQPIPIQTKVLSHTMY